MLYLPALEEGYPAGLGIAKDVFFPMGINFIYIIPKKGKSHKNMVKFVGKLSKTPKSKTQ